jgi:hypothetical protein
MKELSKADRQEMDVQFKALQTAWDALQHAVQHFNAWMDEEWHHVRAAEEDYNKAVADFRTWQADIAQQINDYIESRSEKWQAGDTGQAYQGWVEPWENEDLIEYVTLDKPDEIETTVDEPSEAFGQLATEVEA